MTLAGTITLEFNRMGVNAVAAWLYFHGPYSPNHPDWPKASRIADRLFKCAKRRKRSAAYWGWTVTLDRHEAHWLAARLPLPPAVPTILGARTGDVFLDNATSFGEELRWVLSRRRGRPQRKSWEILDRSRDNLLPDRTWYRRQAQRNAIAYKARSARRRSAPKAPTILSGLE